MIASPETAPRRRRRAGKRRRLGGERHLGERLERQDAAFALVVGLHQEQDVFRRDDDQ